VDVEFDAEKDEINRRKHGLSLADAALIDFDTAAYEPDERRAYGEDRYRAYGLIGGRLHMLVFTMRSETLCAISLRKANKREMERYERQKRAPD
jgi:uncharacterized DUF497 family protein